MKFRVPDIPEEGLEIQADASKDWFGNLVQDAFQEDYQKGGALSLTLRLTRTCDNVSLTGTVEINLRPSCDRCLEAFSRHITIPLDVDLLPYRKEDSGEKEEGDAEDLNVSFYKGEEIDVSQILREMLVLEIPFRYLCSESCKGLCPRCGQNLNRGSCSCSASKGDPRFAILKDLLKRH